MPKYNFVDSLNIKRIDTPMEGRGYAETWPVGEEGTDEFPRPKELPLNQPGVQVFRPKDYDEDMHAGEALHVSPFANKVRDALIQTLTPRQIRILKQQPDYEVGDEEPESRLRNATDAAIRGAVVGQWPEDEVKDFWGKSQKRLLDSLSNYMQTGKVPDRSVKDILEKEMADPVTVNNAGGAAATNPWVWNTTMGGEYGTDVTSAGWQQRDAVTGPYGPMRADDPYASLASYAGPMQRNADNTTSGQNAAGQWEQLLSYGPNKQLLQSQAQGKYDVGAPVQWQTPKSDTGDFIGNALLMAMIAGAGGMAAGGALGAGGLAGEAGGGLDTIGNLVMNVPEGATAGSYAASLGYPSTDAWLAAGAGTGAAGAGGALGTDGLGGSGDIGTGGAEAADSAQFGTAAAPVSVGGPGQFNIMDMLRSLAGEGGTGTGILSKLGTALGLPQGAANALGPLFDVGSGIYGMMQGNDLKKRAAQIAAQSDPMAQYRPGYAAQLQQLMANPSSITSVPGYAAGLQAVERRGAAQGWNGSGNMMNSLANYGGNFYNQQIQNLMGLSGANVNPVAAGQLALGGEQAGASIGMQGLNRVGSGLTQRPSMSDALLTLMLNKMRG